MTTPNETTVLPYVAPKPLLGQPSLRSYSSPNFGPRQFYGQERQIETGRHRMPDSVPPAYYPPEQLNPQELWEAQQALGAQAARTAQANRQRFAVIAILIGVMTFAFGGIISSLTGTSAPMGGCAVFGVAILLIGLSGLMKPKTRAVVAVGLGAATIGMHVANRRMTDRLG